MLGGGIPFCLLHRLTTLNFSKLLETTSHPFHLETPFWLLCHSLASAPEYPSVLGWPWHSHVCPQLGIWVYRYINTLWPLVFSSQKKGFVHTPLGNCDGKNLVLGTIAPFLFRKRKNWLWLVQRIPSPSPLSLTHSLWSVTHALRTPPTQLLFSLLLLSWE